MTRMAQEVCATKRTYMTRRAAKRVLKMHRQKDARSWRDVHPYLCPACCLWHLGHPLGLHRATKIF